MKGLKNAHTPNSKIGSGTHYGQAIKQKTGKMVKDSMSYSNVTPKNLKKPPKSLA